MLLDILLLLSVSPLPSIFTLRVNPSSAARSLVNDDFTTPPLELDFNLDTPSGGGIVESSGGIPPALFLFGDSLCDTGNGPFVNHSQAMSLPFGMTFPGYAIGRFSDGRDVVPDFLGNSSNVRVEVRISRLF